ncbi:hypothetical protein GINT2_000900 [Glugoides intestinalis]
MEQPDYSTIEHDFLHVKDYFSNYKFTYKERRSKQEFLLNINSEPAQDTTSLIASSKEQLVDVKNVYRKNDEEIRDLSEKIYKEELDLNENNEKLQEFTRLELSLQMEYEHLLDLHEKMLINGKLLEEFDDVESNINNVFVEIDAKKLLIDPIAIETKLEEEKQLKEVKNELAAKQRRLTIINTENYIEDIFYWEKQYLEVLNKIFGNLTATISEDRCSLKITKSDGASILELNIRGMKLLDCFLSTNVVKIENGVFEALKQHALDINDARPLLIYFAINC